MTAKMVRYSSGTAALKPVCSRYRNENERIIDYSRAASKQNRRTNYRRISQARHVNKRARIGASICAAVEGSATIQDFRSGDLSGTPFNKRDSEKMKAYGLMYTVMGLAAIISVSI